MQPLQSAATPISFRLQEPMFRLLTRASAPKPCLFCQDLVTYAVTLEWNERERPKNGTLSLEKSAASLEKVRESAVILEKVLFTLL